MKSFTTMKAIAADELERLVGDSCRLRDDIERGSPSEPTLAERCVANLFFEPSTRTRLSFDLAAQRLGARVVTFSPETSSTVKGESLRDTAITVSAIGADILVVRHSDSGAPQAVSEWTGKPVVNAGDGMNEHPTQALVDVVTMTRHFGSVSGLRVVVAGDIAHSRVANSLGHAITVLGGSLIYAAPRQWLPENTDVATTTLLDPAIEDADVVYLLRVQTERGGTITGDYVEQFRLDVSRAARLPEHAIIMHPGPMNRGVEIDDAVADSPRSQVTEQVRNGVPVRMAVFSELARSLP